MLRNSTLFSIVLLLTTPTIVKTSQAPDAATIAAKKAYDRYSTLYDYCCRSTPCIYESNEYGDNSPSYNKCLKQCERFALAYNKKAAKTIKQTKKTVQGTK